jgi:Mrp family chromosome partitioning ATPase
LRPPEAEFTESEIIGGRGPSQADEEEPDAEIVIVAVQALTAERDANKIVIDRLVIDLSVIPDPPQPEELDVRSALEIDALTLDLADFELQYVDLLRRSDGRPPGGFFVEPVITDLTPSEVSVGLYGLIGVVVGAIMASAVLIALDATRQPIWAPSDLEGVVSLGVVNRDRTDGDRQAVWYPASVSRRRRDIQILRAATDAVTEELSTVIGITGIGVSSHEVGEIAADLASAYTVAGRNVLLIDGSGFRPNTLPEFGAHDEGLNLILSQQMSPSDAANAIDRLLSDMPEVASNLTAVRVGGGSFDPFDAFAAPSCRLFMDIAKSKYDTVVLAGPDIADPLADAVARRADFVVLVGLLGHTRSSQFAAAVDVLSDRQTDVAGVVLLRGPRQSISARMRSIATGDVDSAVKPSTRRAARAVAWIKALFGGSENDVATSPSESTAQVDSLELELGLEPESEAEADAAPATVVAGSPSSRQGSGTSDEDLA